ncbi:MAG: Hsp20 family protein [Candidatus Binataceae bacterium]
MAPNTQNPLWNITRGFKDHPSVPQFSPTVAAISNSANFGCQILRAQIAVDFGSTLAVLRRSRPSLAFLIRVSETELPNDAGHDKIQASYKHGVLEVTVEKRPESGKLGGLHAQVPTYRSRSHDSTNVDLRLMNH